MAGSRETLRDLHGNGKKEGSGCADLAVLLTPPLITFDGWFMG